MRKFAGTIAFCAALLLAGCAGQVREQQTDAQKVEPMARLAGWDVTGVIDRMLADRERARRKPAAAD